MTRLFSSSLVLVLSACGSVQPVRPTTGAAPLIAGDRVRVTHSSSCCASPLIGIEQSLTRDSLAMRSEAGKQLAIARSNITEIERWNRGRTHRAAGALVGSFIGAVTAGFIGYQSNCGHCDGDWRPFGAIAGGILGGGIGLATGFLIGARHHGFWEAVTPQ